MCQCQEFRSPTSRLHLFCGWCRYWNQLRSIFFAPGVVMRRSRSRMFRSPSSGIAQRTIIGLILLALVVKPGRLELCAKDKKRVRGAKEQMQEVTGAKQTT